MEKTTAGQFSDTTHTKVFVGGLAWETQKDAVKKHFEQFGEILEAVVITDKSTGRSKGYGFVTFREAEAATKACVEATPVIDGRRANCNLAASGVQRSKPSPLKTTTGGRNGKVVTGGGQGIQGAVQAPAAAFPSVAAFPNYAIPQGIGIPYSQIYRYPPYSPQPPTGYYGVYGAAASRYPLYGTGSGLLPGAVYYSYMNMSNRAPPAAAAGGYYAAGCGYGVPYHHPHHVIQYPATPDAPVYPPHYGTHVSRPPVTNSLQSVCYALPQG